MADDDVWESIDRLRSWLDAHRTHGGQEGLLLRILKLSEEVGEVAEAVIGATGQNPRKGASPGGTTYGPSSATSSSRL
jgi:NTP pyrophosphatase (non-canonical NTP hydrolase)